MARPKNKIKTSKLNTSLPEDLRQQLDDYLRKLYSGVIPGGSYQKFIVNLIRSFFTRKGY